MEHRVKTLNKWDGELEKKKRRFENVKVLLTLCIMCKYLGGMKLSTK